MLTVFEDVDGEFKAGQSTKTLLDNIAITYYFILWPSDFRSEAVHTSWRTLYSSRAITKTVIARVVLDYTDSTRQN